MGTIKMFNGGHPPFLKNGEWASNGIYAYLGLGIKKNKIFQSVFDVDINQEIVGFSYDAETRSFYIPEGTHLSQVQKLLDNLPKAIKLKTDGDKPPFINIVFEDNTEEHGEPTVFIDDLQHNFTIRDFSFKIRFVRKFKHGAIDHIPKLIFERQIVIFNSDVEFSELILAASESWIDTATELLYTENSSLTLALIILRAIPSHKAYLSIGANSNVKLSYNSYEITNYVTPLYSIIRKIDYGAYVMVEGRQNFYEIPYVLPANYLVRHQRGNLYVSTHSATLDGSRKIANHLCNSCGGFTNVSSGLVFTTENMMAINRLTNAMTSAGMSYIKIDTSAKTLRISGSGGTITFTGQ